MGNSMSGDTGDSDCATAVVVVLRRFLYDLGRFSEENGLTGMLRDDLQPTTSSVASHQHQSKQSDRVQLD